MRIVFLFAILLCHFFAWPQDPWHNQSREMRYRPDGKDFVIENGTHRFNRALYGTNSGFRVETGDLPEFALYLPGMGGNLRLGLLQGDSSAWLTDAKFVEARYQAGTMRYLVTDPMLGKGKLSMQILALSDGEGMIAKLTAENTGGNTDLLWIFGGATGKKFSRDGDLGADPESLFFLKPEYCADNEYVLSKNSFYLYFGSGRVRSQNERYENNYLITMSEPEQTRLQLKKRLFGIFPENSGLPPQRRPG